jgi:lysophospholipase L1-like esterase
MEWYEAEVRAMEQARAAAPRPPGAVVFYGSSSIRLWSSLSADFSGVDVVNAGFGGSTLAACVYFFERLVVPYRPRSLVVYAGDNDLGDGRSPEDVLGSFRALIQKTNAMLGPIPFGFISIKPSPARWHLFESIRRANEMVRQELETRPSSYYIDVFPAMLDANGGPRRELYTEDGLHMSPAGYRLWVETLASYREQLLLRSEPTKE